VLKVSVLKRKSSIALITAIIVMILLIPIWYVTLIPYFIAGGLENIDETTTIDGYVRGFGIWALFKAEELPIRLEAHAYTEKVRGENVIMKVESKMIRTDTNETLEDFSGNSTYVFNKFTRKYVPDAPEADVNRTGYGATLYPSHLNAGQNISNVWSDSLNTTVTLVFNRTVVEDGITLYKYCLNETITQNRTIENRTQECIVTSTSTILIEPLMGVPAYIENETFSLSVPRVGLPPLLFIYLTYTFSDAAKVDGLANARMAHDGMQLLELYIPAILGVIVIILTVGLAFNIRRLKRKKPPKPETQSPASHTP